jgi:hypothetical protein
MSNCLRGAGAMAKPVLNHLFAASLLFWLACQVVPHASATVITPNTGVSWGMSDLASNFPTVVTGEGTNYFLHDHVVIASKDTLTIAPGTVITRDGDASNVRMTIFGTLIAAGTSNQPILFTSTMPAPCSYSDYCLSFVFGSSKSIVNWVVCEKAHAGFSVGVAGLTLSNCVARECHAGFYSTVAVTFDHCRSENNGNLDCPQWGAGAFCNGGAPTFRNCTFTGNQTGTNAGFNAGGGIGLQRVSNARIEGCTIVSNRAQFGGGIMLYQCNTVLIRSNTIYGNQVLNEGFDHNAPGIDLIIAFSNDVHVKGNPAASHVYWYSSSGSFVNNVLNGADAFVGATASSTIIAHNLFTGTAGTVDYLGIMCWDTDTNLIANNILGPGFAIQVSTTNSPPRLRNNLFEPAPVGRYYNVADTWFVEINDVNGLPGNSGNIVAPSGMNLENLVLPFDSPCIDAGFDAGVLDDLSGNPRPLDGRLEGTLKSDIGPVEAYPLWLLDPSLTPTTGDSQTWFQFSVSYKGSSPRTAQVFVDGTGHDMTPVAGSSSGTTYRWESRLGPGPHGYFFLFEDAVGKAVRAPETGSTNGPLVNDAPVAICTNITVVAGADCTAAALADGGSFDRNPDDRIIVVQDPPGPYPLGETMVTLTVVDSFGASASCRSKITVIDATPPNLACPPNIVVNPPADGTGTNLFFTATASDFCDAGVRITCVPPSGSAFMTGTTRVECAAQDSSGNVSTCGFLVRVNTRPDLALIHPTNGTVFIWPQSVPLLAEARDPDGDGVARVSFFSDAMLLGIATNNFTVNWSRPALGAHRLSLVAADGLGLESTSGVTTVSVIAQPPLNYSAVTTANLNRQTGLHLQRVRITNPTPQDFIPQRLWVTLDTNSLAHGVRVWNAAGASNGLPYFAPGQVVPPGHSAEVVIAYRIPDRRTMPVPAFKVDVAAVSPPSSAESSTAETRIVTNPPTGSKIKSPRRGRPVHSSPQL